MFRLPVSVRGGVPGVRVRQLPPVGPSSSVIAEALHRVYDHGWGLTDRRSEENPTRAFPTLARFTEQVEPCCQRGTYFADDEGWLDTDGDLEDQIYSEFNPGSEN